MKEQTHSSLSVKTCFLVWISLLIFTALTVAVAEVDFGLFHVLVSMVIATCKAGLVIFWFMHIKFESITIKLMVFVAFLILAIFISFTFFDVAYR